MSLEVDVHATAGSFTLDAAFTTNAGTTALLGASGAGKTLTLRAIAGLLTPESGRVVLDGRMLFDRSTRTNVPVRQRRVGYVFQDYALFPHLSVTANLAFGLRGWPTARVAEAVARMLRLLRLEGLEERSVQGLSGGERQRVALGRALAPRPDLLLLDEPFSALDTPARAALTEELGALRDSIDVPMVLVTHDVSEAYALADHLIVLAAGRVIQSGPKTEVFDRPATPAAARLLGVQNVLPAVVVSVGETHAEIDLGGLSVTVPVTGLSPGGPVLVGLRASDVSVEPVNGTAGRGNAALVREVDRGMWRGIVLATPRGAEIVAELPRWPGGPLPDRWHVTLPGDRARVWPPEAPERG